MAVDKASLALMAQLANAGVRPIEEMTPIEARAFAARLRPAAEAKPAEHSRSFCVDYAGGQFDVRILYPASPPKALIIYYHGGGWVLGGIKESEGLAQALADASGCAIVLVDYRLAPEHPFPTAIDDAYAGLEWACAKVVEIAGKAIPLIVAGDSSGGNIAAVVALKARESGPEVAGQILIYPVTDAGFSTQSYTDPENQLLLTRGAMEWFWNHYLPDASMRRDPRASPLQAKDLSGLAPAIVITAGHDPLRDEGEAYAARLIQAGVSVDFKRYADQMHGFFTLLDVLPGSRRAILDVASAMQKWLR